MIELFETFTNEISIIKETNTSTLTYDVDIKVKIEKEYNYVYESTDVETEYIDSLLSSEVDAAIDIGLNKLTAEINDAIHKNPKYKNLNIKLHDTDEDFKGTYIWNFGSIESPTAVEIKELEKIINDVCSQLYFYKTVEYEFDIGRQIPGTGYPSFDPPEYYSVGVAINLELVIDEYIKFTQNND